MKDERHETIEKSVTDCNHLGNAAKMREALSMIVDACSSFHQFIENGLDGHYEAIPNYDGGVDDFLKCVDYAKSALSSPPRNCDIGTPEEQAERFHSFCESNKQCGDVYSCECCQLNSIEDCELAWSQMPYEEGGAK